MPLAATAVPSVLEYKATPAAPDSGLLGADDETGVVEAIVSVTGVEDDVADIIEPGAYAKTLAKRRPKGIFVHDWGRWVARTEHIEELMPGDKRLPTKTKSGQAWPQGAGGLYVRARFNLGTREGSDAYENVKFFSETGECDWSVGYKVPKGAGVRTKDGKRRIKEMDLYEYSPVLFGAAPLSGTLSVKAGLPAAEEAAQDVDWDDVDALTAAVETLLDGPEAPEEEPETEGPPNPVDPDEGAEGGDEEQPEATLYDGPEEEPEEEPAVEGEPDEGVAEESETATEEDKAAGPPFKKTPPKSGSGASAETLDGKYKITDVESLKNAIKAYGSAPAGEQAKLRAHIMKRAFALKHPELIPDSWKEKGAPEEGLEEKRDIGTQRRREMAKEGNALPDGSYPIATVEDLKNAIKAYGRANPEDRAKVRRHIMKRARALGHPELIPDDWKSGKEADDDLETKLRHESLNRSPRKNWVEMAGQLPAYIQHIAKDIHEEKGVPLEVAIPTAIAAVKRWAAGGGNVTAETRSKAAAAVAEWEALKAKSHARSAAKGLSGAVESDIYPYLPGTLEELREQVARAAEKALMPEAAAGDSMVDVVGTWSDRVVVACYDLTKAGPPTAYEIPYQLDGDQIDLGEPTAVQLTVTADGDEGPGEQLTPYPALVDEITLGVKAELLAAPETKAGRVLSGANANRLKSAVEQLVAVLKAAGIEIGEPDKKDEEEQTENYETVDSTAPSARMGDVNVPAGKVLLDPGLVARAYRIVGEATKLPLELKAQDWKPGEHPRDKRGRFIHIGDAVSIAGSNNVGRVAGPGDRPGTVKVDLHYGGGSIEKSPGELVVAESGHKREVGGGWSKHQSAMGGYMESRKLNGHSLTIIGTPNGNFKYRIDGKHQGLAKTVEEARRKAEQAVG